LDDKSKNEQQPLPTSPRGGEAVRMALHSPLGEQEGAIQKLKKPQLSTKDKEQGTT